MKVIYTSRDEIKLTDKEKDIYDLGHGQSGVLTCIEPKDGQDRFTYIKDKHGYIQMENGGYLILKR